MKVGVMQPTFFPWLGYFELISKTDRFVFLDSVELSKQSWQTRNVFQNANSHGWQSIPIRGGSQQTINYSEINNFNRFINKLRRTVINTHSKSTNSPLIFDFFDNVANEEFITIADFNIYVIKYFCNLLGIKSDFLRSSEMFVSGVKDDLIIRILDLVACDTYIASPGSKNYMENFGIQNYPCNVIFFDYSKSINISYLYDGYGYENIIDLLTRISIKEVSKSVF